MKTFRIKLIETSTTQGSIEFPVAASSAEAAAALVSQAYQVARAQNVDVVALPDGQSSVIETDEVVERTTRLVLLDAQGADLQTIVPRGVTNGLH